MTDVEYLVIDLFENSSVVLKLDLIPIIDRKATLAAFKIIH